MPRPRREQGRPACLPPAGGRTVVWQQGGVRGPVLERQLAGQALRRLQVESHDNPGGAVAAARATGAVERHMTRRDLMPIEVRPATSRPGHRALHARRKLAQ